jgi:hypothetical protein
VPESWRAVRAAKPGDQMLPQAKKLSQLC